MTAEEVRLVVRKPLADIEQEVRRKYGVVTPLLETSIEPDSLVLTFAGTGGGPSPKSAQIESLTVPSPTRESSAATSTPRRRSKRRVRQRTKTRGWDVLGKFRNSGGQTCTIYRPMYDVLTSRKLRRREAYSEIRKILVANGNNPKPASVEYYLKNTLEYISAHPPTGGVS
jgi:hypothetical protein